jgi:hypothetical protein
VGSQLSLYNSNVGTSYRPEMGITKPPQDSVGFTVIVVPKSLCVPCWRFVVLLAKDDSSQADKIIPDICRMVLESGDQYSISNFGLDDEDQNLDGVGVISYYEESPDTFDWITVPPHLRN